MVRIRISVPSLIHGISQLPASERAPAHAESNVNCWPTVEHGQTKRPPLVHVAKVHTGSFTTTGCLTSKIDRGTGEQYITISKLFDSTLGGTPGAGAMKIFDLSGTTYLIQDSLIHTNVSQFAYLGLSAADVTAGYLAKSQEQIRQLSVFDKTYVLNRRQSPTMNGSIFTPTKPKGHAYIFIRVGNYALKYSITLKIAGINLGSGVGVERTVFVNTADSVGPPAAAPTYNEGYECWGYAQIDFPGGVGVLVASAKQQDIAQLFLEKLTGVVHAGVYGNQITAGLLTVTRIGAVLKIVTAGAAAGLDFASLKVTSPADQFAYSIWNEIDGANDLPEYCTHDYVVTVKGAVSSPEDDFYVKFVADEGTGVFGRGDWAECAQAADPAALSAFPIAISSVTTPQTLTRRTDDGLGGYGLGVVTGIANWKYWTFDPVTWDQVIAGDIESNPQPTLVGTSRHIQDIVYFKDRLCLLYEDGLHASEQGEQLNFFRTTVRYLPDTDPIDSQLNTDEVGILHSAIGIAAELVLLSKDAQLVYRGNPILTPTTAEAPRVAKNGSVLTARPAAFEGGTIFGVDLGVYIGLRNLVRSALNENVFDAANLTLHASTFISAPLRQIEVSTDNSTIVALGGTTNTIYLLKQHREGDQTVQSAWFSFTIEDAAVLGCHFFGTRLYIVSQRTEGVFLEYIELSPGIDDGGRAYWLHLDRRVTNTSAGVSIGAFGGGVTVITMPYDIEVAPVVYEVVTIANSTRYTATRTAAGTMTVPVDLAGLAFVAGRKYACTHGFHKPQVMLNQRTGRAMVLDQESSVLQLKIRYESTSYLELYVGTDVTKIGNSTTGFLGTTDPLTGEITAGIGQRLELPWLVYASNPTPFPHSMVSAEWLMNLVARSAALS